VELESTASDVEGDQTDPEAAPCHCWLPTNVNMPFSTLFVDTHAERVLISPMFDVRIYVAPSPVANADQPARHVAIPQVILGEGRQQAVPTSINLPWSAWNDPQTGSIRHGKHIATTS